MGLLVSAFDNLAIKHRPNSVEHVKEQWRNLKDIFYKRYELMVKRAQRGEPASRVRPCWSLFNDLKFLASPEAMGGRFRRGIECGT